MDLYASNESSRLTTVSDFTIDMPRDISLKERLNRVRSRMRRWELRAIESRTGSVQFNRCLKNMDRSWRVWVALRKRGK